jgi:DNA-binding ferritin-like protein
MMDWDLQWGRVVTAKEFATDEALKKHLQDHPKADKTKHWVKGEEPDKAKKDEEPKDEAPKDEEEAPKDKPKAEEPKVKSPLPEPNFLAKDRPATEAELQKFKDSVARNKLAEKYHLDLVAGPPEGEVTVNDLIRAKHVAEAAIANIEKDASKPEGDLCQIRPNLCRGNRGIDRSSMPQLMEEPIGKMLQSDNAKDRKKAKAYIEAAKAQGRSDEEIEELLKSSDSPKDLFIKELEDEVGYDSDEVTVADLKATQKNIKANKSYGMAESFLLGEDSPWAKDKVTGEVKAWSPFEAEIIISSDGYILDGHHRWSSGVISDPDKKMKVKRINMKMDDLLGKAFEFPGTFRADINDEIIPNDAPLDLARAPGSTWKQSTGYYGKNKEGEAQGPYKTEEAAKQYATGKKSEPPKEEEPKEEPEGKKASFHDDPFAKEVIAEVGDTFDAADGLATLLGRLKSLYWFHWTAHWQAAGPGFYADHEMFARMKDEAAEEIDGLAERIVGYHGAGVVDPHHIMEHEHAGMAPQGAGFDLAGQALQLEKDFQAELKTVYSGLEGSGGLTMGLDDFLQAMASTHDTHVYLLQQRLGGKRASNEWQEEPTQHAAEWDEWAAAGLLTEE